MQTDIATIGAVVVLASFGFLFAGPLGAILVGILVVLVGAGIGQSSKTERATVNCPKCGVLVSTDDSTCSYCNTSVGET